MMKKIWKRALSLLLAVLMLTGAAPLGVLAVHASAKTISEYAQGDLVEFGWYPQSRVTDPDLIASLTAALTGDDLISYGYYAGYYSGTVSSTDGQMLPSDYMLYCDVLLGGVKYRWVWFSQYRPYYTGNTSSADYTYQDDNGYENGTPYWFRFEPLQWRVLDPAAGLVMCETIIDSQPYNNYILFSGVYEYNNTVYWGDAGRTHYANNYAESSLRQWLNNDFYNTAFSPLQQDIIKSATLDNSAYSAYYSAYDSASTTDKVFLLSYSDARNTSYGFASDTDRKAQGSDYAKCQGLYVYKSNKCSYWWLRSAGENCYRACIVKYDGWVSGSFYSVNGTYIGIRPAFKLNLTSEIFQSDVSDLFPSHELVVTTVEPTCTENGSRITTCTHCDYRKEVILPALGHDRKTTIVNATCTKAGFKITACTRCGEIYEEKYDRLPHQYNEVVTAPTATKGGYTTYTCSMCGRKVTAHETPPTGSEVYTLTYNANGGTVQQQATYSKTYSKGGTITKYTPVRSGYTFVEWYPSLPSTMPDYDLTVYAIWKPEHTHETVILNQKEPTCDTNGQTGIVYCETCSEILDFGIEIPAKGHTWDKGTVTTEATCTEPGVKTFTCRFCDATKEEAIPAWGHCYDNGFISIDPACLDEGEKMFTCAACGVTYTEPVPAVGHSFDNGIVTTAATCTEEGIKTFTCTRCNTETYTEPVPATGHSFDNGKVTTAATCTEEGVKTFTCTRCKTETYTKPIPATGHNIDSGVVTTEPTCTEEGIKSFTCLNCKTVMYTEPVPATGHSFDSGVVTTEPTCTEEGVKTFTCTRCNTETYTEPVAATGHSYDNGVVTTDPKCAEDGVKTFTCSKCGGAYTEPVPMLGHKYTFAIETLPTCTEYGAMRYTCSVCGDSYLSPIKAAHKYNAVTTEPTCTEQGYTTYTCSVCGDSYVDHYTDPAHKYEDTITEPTCVIGGYTTYTCKVCGDSYTDTETKPAGHRYDKTIVYPSSQSGGSVTYHCSVCGKEYTVKLDSYDIIEFGSYPQTRVTDPKIVNTFIAEAQSGVYVTSYRYLYGSSNDNLTNGSMKSYDYMVYWDTYYGNDKYRVVYFNQYRPISTGGRPQESSSWQPDNGYYVDNYYVFKWEPLRWKVLDAETGLVMCESIIDAQPFNNYIISKTVNNKKVYYGDDGTTYANNYAKSSIRKWLNSMGTTYDDPNYLPSFYINAFNDSEKACIIPTKLDNTGSYSSHPEYNCESTTDKVFLLSYQDVTNPKYGFNADPDATREDSGRLATATDYAKCQGLGVCVSEDESYKHWKLRNGTWDSDLIGEVLFYGLVSQSGATYTTTEGIRPAMTLDLAALGIDQTNPPDHTYDDGVMLTNATCTENGKRVDCCLVCGDTREVKIPAKGHNYAVNVLAAEDCTNDGEVEYTCSVCGDTHKKTVPALGHDYVQTITPVTCTEDGVTTYTCSRCGDSYTENLAALGHSYDAVVIEPTCTADGYTTHICARCGDQYTDSETSPLGHDYVGAVTTKPTGTAEGVMTYTCSRCGDSYTEAIEKLAVGDADEDGEVGLTDVAQITRYLAGGWDIAVDSTVADVNKDGEVNLKDAVLLRRYLAGGWDVQIG